MCCCVWVGAAPLLLLLLLLLELPLELLLHPSGLWPRCGCDGVKQRARVSERWGGSGHRARSGGAGIKGRTAGHVPRTAGCGAKLAYPAAVAASSATPVNVVRCTIEL